MDTSDEDRITGYSVYCVSGNFSDKQAKVDKKAMNRNRYNRILYPVLNTKTERDTYN